MKLENRGLTIGIFGLFVLLSMPLLFFIGEDFFPYVDSGQMRLHVYPPEGMRPEDAEQYFAPSNVRSGTPSQRKRPS